MFDTLCSGDQPGITHFVIRLFRDQFRPFLH
jgi:hypothetical protein